MSSPAFLPIQPPDGWIKDRIRDRLRRIVGGDWGADPGTADDLVDVVVVRVADMNGINIELASPTIRAVTPSSLETRRLRSGSLLLEKSGGGETQNVGRVAIVRTLQDDAICSNFMAVMDADAATCPAFLNYAFCALYNAGMNFPSVKQTTGIQNLDVTAYLSSHIAFPPGDEQERIAAYLDASALAIEAAVSAKQEQIKTLTNHFAVTVHRAVTAGLDTACEFVDSNEAWLREVPRHWTPTRIRDVAALSPGHSGREFPTADTYVVAPMECVSTMGDIVLSEQRALEDIGPGMVVFEPGDVLFAKITPCMENGKGAFVPELPTPVAFGSTEFHVLRPTHHIDGTFLYYYTWNPVFRRFASENMVGAAGQKRVSSRFLKDVRLFLPPMHEQMAISEHLVEQRRRYIDVKTRIETQIELLRSYLKSLIHECVTGRRRITDDGLNRVSAHAASIA